MSKVDNMKLHVVEGTKKCPVCEGKMERFFRIAFRSTGEHEVIEFKHTVTKREVKKVMTRVLERYPEYTQKRIDNGVERAWKIFKKWRRLNESQTKA